MVTRFMVVMPWGRVGSNLLMSLINQAKESKKLNSEIFNQLKTPEEQLAWLAEFYAFGREPAVQLTGSKQSVLSIRNLPAVETVLRANDVKIIRMRRDDCLKAAVSQIRAEQYARETLEKNGKARWAVRKGEEPLGPSHVPPDILSRRIGIMKTQQDVMMAGFAGLDTLDIEYEEINFDLEATYRRLSDFLGFCARSYAVPFVKATPGDLRSAVNNYEEICENLRGGPYAMYLPEDVAANK